MEVEVLVGILLAIQSYWDIKEQKIHTCFSVVGGALGFLLSMYTGRECLDVCMALVPGISFLAISWLSKECVGYGDGILICALGFFYTWNTLCVLLFAALLFSAGAALVLFAIFKKSGNDTIPFVPFLLLGWFVHMCI